MGTSLYTSIEGDSSLFYTFCKLLNIHLYTIDIKSTYYSGQYPTPVWSIKNEHVKYDIWLQHQYNTYERC